MLSKCEDRFSLEGLAARIRKSSNFRFEWQFYQSTNSDISTPAGIRQALEQIIVADELHRFLRTSFDPMCGDEFKIEPLYDHCQVITAAQQFEETLAEAAGDHLGAYSRELRSATSSERQEIDQLFRQSGDYMPFQVLPGYLPHCPVCREYHTHFFTNWFFSVAWDWCFFVSWPERNSLWMGCLTDTD